VNVCSATVRPFNALRGAQVRLAAVAIGVLFITSMAAVQVGAVAKSPPASVHVSATNVPWGSVGPGWLLATWEPHPQEHPLATYLLLVAPSGARYVLFRLPNDSGLADWSGDGRRILVETANNPNANVPQPGRFFVIDLRTGVVDATFRPGGGVEDTASFTAPRGLALLAANLGVGATVSLNTEWLERYSLGGVPQLRYPNSFPRVGAWTGQWLESPDGVDVIMGASHGLAIVGNNGVLAATLPITGATDCMPVANWGPSVFLASCMWNRNPNYLLLYEFSGYWSKPRQLTAPPPPDNDSGFNYGYIGAWRAGNEVMVNVVPSCGPTHLGVLHGHHVSLLEPLKTAAVVGTTPTSLALEDIGGECVGGSIAISWYHPSTNTSHEVIGPSSIGGWVTGAVGYPTLSTTSGPFGE
jgi:hypothetical protein